MRMRNAIWSHWHARLDPNLCETAASLQMTRTQPLMVLIYSWNTFQQKESKNKRYYLLNFWIHFSLNWVVRFQYCPLQHKGHYRLISFYVAYLKLSFWRSSDDNHSQLGIWSFSRGNLEWINIAFGSCLLKESFKATSSPFQSHILFRSEKLFITAAALHFSHDGLVLFKVH